MDTIITASLLTAAIAYYHYPAHTNIPSSPQGPGLQFSSSMSRPYLIESQINLGLCTTSSQVHPKGLANKGNYCYRNAIYQTLFHMPGFVAWVAGHLNNTCALAEEPTSCLTCHLHQALWWYWVCESEASDYDQSKTVQINNMINKLAEPPRSRRKPLFPMLSNGIRDVDSQQDAADFLLFLLAELRTDEM